MPLRIVVSFRGALALDAAGGETYIERALSTKKRAEAQAALVEGIENATNGAVGTPAKVARE